MADSGVGRRHMIEAPFFPNPIAERAPHDQPHHQFDALGSGIAEIFDMRHTGETICIARPAQDQRTLCTKWDAQTRIRASEGAYLDRDLR
jgi:hypothetical protein